MNLCCIGIVLIFSDAVWRPAALQLERELRAPCVCVEHIDMPAHYFNQTAVWGTAGYFERIRHRLPLVRQRLLLDNNTDGGWLALFDADIVALRNVGARFTRTFQSAPQVQLLVQQEWPCDTAPYRLCVNGGLWVVRRSAPAALALLTQAEQLIERLHIPDQDALQIAVNAAPPATVVFLDRWRYPNGYMVRKELRWHLHDAHAVHCNWIRDVQAKLQCLAHVRAARFHSI